MREWVLITGASSGIGRATAVALSGEYNLILCGRDETRLNSVVEECNCGGGTLLPFKIDLCDIDVLQNRLLDFLKEHEISVSGFVHCAGVSKLMPLRSVRTCDISEIFNTNLVAPFLVVQALMNWKVNKKVLRSVVFISSNISNRGAKAFSIYGASKGGLDALMRSLAVELAPNVRVNSVLPGQIRTRMTEDIFENYDAVEKMKERYPLGLGEVGDVANVVQFLLSGKSRWITGQQFTVDGGVSIDITG